MMDVDFYGRIVARYGQAKTDDFFRFFPLAGMGHCGGGEGFSHIGGATGAALQNDADHDMVRALERWVTTREAPFGLSSGRIWTMTKKLPPPARSAAIPWKRATAAMAVHRKPPISPAARRFRAHSASDFNPPRR